MKHILQPPGVGLCLIYSTAMLLNTKPEKILKKLEKMNLHALRHIQTIQRYLATMGKALAPIELFPTHEEDVRAEQHITEDEECELFLNTIRGRIGLILTATHALAWDGKKAFDPNGKIYDSILDIPMEEFYLLCDLPNQNN